MFKELRNKFLILNLVIISVMMIIAFTSIYLITYNNVHSDIQIELHKLSEVNFKPHELPFLRKGIPSTPSPKDAPDIPARKRSFTFTLTMDASWDIVAVSSVFDMDNEFYETAKNAALHQYKIKGAFKLDSSHWAFITKKHKDEYKIFFLDITSQQNFLANLIYTFLIVACITLVFIFFISRFFANKAINPIKKAFDKQKQFIADASHELKTPLAVISTNVDVLLSNSAEAINSESKWLYYIKSETERMAKLTNDLLYLTQVDYSDIKTIFTDFNLSETALNIILTMEAIIFENNLYLKYDIDPDIIICGNMEQIKQVIMILLDNAAKYTNTMGYINISLKKHYNHSILSVTNTGEGIPEEDLDKIFDRFYRIDKARSREKGGHGLGLAIAKSIAQQHNGKISVKSTLHESTSFRIELPYVNNQ